MKFRGYQQIHSDEEIKVVVENWLSMMIPHNCIKSLEQLGIGSVVVASPSGLNWEYDQAKKASWNHH